MKTYKEFLGEMAADHQERGTCQICGRQQAVRAGGNITHHGYTIQYGWFQGTCPGQKHKPLEVDKSETVKQIADIKSEIPKIEQTIKKLKSGKMHPLKVVNGHSGYGKNRTTHYLEWKDAPPGMQASAVKDAIYNEERRIKDGHETIKFLEKLITDVHGKETAKITRVAKKVMTVGSVVNISGSKNVTITKIEGKTARGCGPFLNGQFLPHAHWIDSEGRERSDPIRLARWPKEK